MKRKLRMIFLPFRNVYSTFLPGSLRDQSRGIAKIAYALSPKAIFLLMLCCVTPVLAGTSSESNDAQQFQGFDLAGYGADGQKQWDVQGDNADILGDIVELTNVVANSYGQEKMNLTARSGSIDKANGNMHLEKDVVVTSETGAQLMTDSLDWHKEKDLVTTNDDVFLSKEGMTATGNGAIVYPTQNTAQISRNVVVNVKPDPQSTMTQGHLITITSDGPMDVEYAGGKAVFTDNVVAVDGDRKLMADRMTVLVHPETNQINQMICEGNVTIIQGENVAHAEKAVYRAGDQRLTLSGRPKLVFYAQEGGGLMGE